MSSKMGDWKTPEEVLAAWDSWGEPGAPPILRRELVEALRIALQQKEDLIKDSKRFGRSPPNLLK